MFAAGGHRACYVHPEWPDRVVKVELAGKSPAEKRAAAPFFKGLRPLRSFDCNNEEYRNLRWIEQLWGDVKWVPTLYGKCETNLGSGVCTQLCRDADGTISRTLEHYLWQHPETVGLREAIERFAAGWEEMAIPTRSLMLYNIVWQRDAEGGGDLCLIDDFGLAETIPFVKFSARLRRGKVRRRLAQFWGKVEDLTAYRSGAKTIPADYAERIAKRTPAMKALEQGAFRILAGSGSAGAVD